MHLLASFRRPRAWSTAHFVFTLLSWSIVRSVGGSEYLLVVISTNSSGHVHNYEECEARGAQFGREISGDDSVTACAVGAVPLDACDEVSSPPQNQTFGCISGYFAVAMRGNCSFAQKAFQAQVAGYNGVVIYNYERENDPVDMASDDRYGPQVTVPAFMLGHDCGISLVKKYFYEKGFAFYVRLYWSYHDLLRYLVPFAAVVGVCFVLVLAAMVVKLVRDRRRRSRRRLSKKQLKQILTKKFSPGDNPDTCPICLDDFEVGDNLRVLPCDHVYHCHCVDPWLLKTRRVCPVCKRKVLPKQADASNSDSDTEDTNVAPTDGPPTGEPSTPERTALLINDERQLTVGNSTFYGVCAITSDSTTLTSHSPGDHPSSPEATHAMILSRSSSPDEQSNFDDPVIDVSGRQSLLPQTSLQSSTDEQNLVTASSSIREGYANPNFVIDPQELESGLDRLATDAGNEVDERPSAGDTG